MEKLGAWKGGDRLVNQGTGKQGTVYRIEVSILIAVTGGSIVVGKQAALEDIGWILESQGKSNLN